MYEVNLDVEDAVAPEFRVWLDGHVREILALTGFTGAQIYERRDPAPAPSRQCLCVHYRVASESDLERYFTVDAPRLRAEGLTRFGNHFTATRRVLRSL